MCVTAPYSLFPCAHSIMPGNLVQAHWQHYTEPSAEPLPATSTVSGTVLPLGPGTLTHNSAGVPIVVVCTKADLIDEGNDIIGSGPSGMGGMVKGKGGEWEERTDSIMQVLRTICLKCSSRRSECWRYLLTRPLYRRCRVVLYHTTTGNSASAEAVLLTHPIHAPCAFARYGFRGRSDSSSPQPIPIPAQAESTRPGQDSDTSWLGQLGNHRIPPGWFRCQIVERSLGERHRGRRRRCWAQGDEALRRPRP